MFVSGHKPQYIPTLSAPPLRRSLLHLTKAVRRLLKQSSTGMLITVQYAGVLDDVDAIFALHNWPSLPDGMVASRSGTLMAGTAEYRITMHGRGGHAAMPHQNIDPIPAVASLVSALQVRWGVNAVTPFRETDMLLHVIAACGTMETVFEQDTGVSVNPSTRSRLNITVLTTARAPRFEQPLKPKLVAFKCAVQPVSIGAYIHVVFSCMQTIVSRETSPTSSLVISVTQLEGGDAHNIIPDNAWLGGTLRALTMDEYERGKQRLVEVAESVAKAHRCNVTVDWDRRSGYPPLVNHAVAWEFAKDVAQKYAEPSQPSFLKTHKRPTIATLVASS
jgi:metal-dependent amidase/aminoacylase/carboxypeptidase family protein